MKTKTLRKNLINFVSAIFAVVFAFIGFGAYNPNKAKADDGETSGVLDSTISDFVTDALIDMINVEHRIQNSTIIIDSQFLDGRDIAVGTTLDDLSDSYFVQCLTNEINLRLENEMDLTEANIKLLVHISRFQFVDIVTGEGNSILEAENPLIDIIAGTSTSNPVYCMGIWSMDLFLYDSFKLIQDGVNDYIVPVYIIERETVPEVDDGLLTKKYRGDGEWELNYER